jgi:prepilin-type N-terminal cleavage/methylation domain-containing protein
MNKNNKLQKGFTLVELLVVIAIIGILATLLLLQLGVARQRARDARRIADINQVRSALELYYDDQGTYPAVATYAGLAAPLVQGTTQYLTLLPLDPLNVSPHQYGYAYVPAAGGGTAVIRYHLWAELEQSARGALGSDADINSTSTQTFTWTGQTQNGATEACASRDNVDCVYDVGQAQ